MSTEQIVLAEAAYNQVQHIQQTKTVPLDDYITARILTGEIDQGAAELAISVLISRHESLRTYFKEINGEIKQVIHPNSKNFFMRANIGGCDREELLTGIRQIHEKEALEISKVDDLPLAKFVLIYFEEPKVFILDVLINHIISDAWSSKLIKSEFEIIYKSIRSNSTHNLTENLMQLKEYCHHQNSLIDKHKENIVSYWKKKLGHYEQRCDVMTYYKGHESRMGKNVKLTKYESYSATRFLEILNFDSACTYRFVFGEDFFSKIKFKAHSIHCFISMFMYACVAVLLNIYTKENDILIASPMADRGDANKANVIGNLMGGVYIPVKFSGEMTIDDVISDVTNNFLVGTHQIIFDHNILGLNLPILRSRTDIYINYISNPSTKIDKNTIEQNRHIPDKNPYYPLSCIVQEFSNAMLISWKYNNLLLSPATIEDLAQCLETLVDAMTEEAFPSLKDLSDRLLKDSAYPDAAQL